jgi:hypothetical protein
MKYSYFLLTGIVSLLFVGPVLARDITRQELLNYDNFLDSHPAIERDLQKDPSLLKNTPYISAHPELRTFLGSNPGIRDSRENPRALMNRERAFEKSGKDISRSDVRNFDDFLDRNPALEKELQKHPALVNDPAFLAKHPDLRQFLDRHPSIRQDLRENPRAFMRQEKKFEKVERKEEKAQIKEEKAQRKEFRRDERRVEHRESKLAEQHSGKH